MKRKFGVKGTAGATPASRYSQSTAITPSTIGFKKPMARRGSFTSSVADTDDGMTAPNASSIQPRPLPSALAGKAPPKPVRPRVSIMSPTPGSQPAARPSSVNHARRTSSTSTLASIAGLSTQPLTSNTKLANISDTESLTSSVDASNLPMKNPLRPTSSTTSTAARRISLTSPTSIPGPPSSFRRTSSISMSQSSHIRKPSAALSIGDSEDSVRAADDKENLLPLPSVPLSPTLSESGATPKPAAIRRRVAVPA